MCGGGCGKVLAIGAMIAMPWAAPALGGALFGASSVLSTAVGGALIGGAAAGIGGGNILQGAFFGGLGSGLGQLASNMGGVGGISDSFQNGTLGADFGSAISNVNPGSSVGLTSGMTGGEVATPDVNSMGAASNALSPNQASGPLLGSTSGSSLINPNGQIGMGNATGAGGTQGFTNATGVADLTGNTAPMLASGAADGTTGGFMGNLGLSSDGLMRALPGLAGTLGNNGPDMDALKAQLDAQNAMNNAAYNSNVANTNAKSAIGDKLAINAANMDPNYYGLQAETSAKNADANTWADQEAKMHAAGYDSNYINAQRQKFALGASQNAGTAYDAGAQRGVQAQNATYGTAGSMYNTGLSAPSSSASDYLALNKRGNENASAAGSAIESIFSPVQKTNKSAGKDSVA